MEIGASDGGEVGIRVGSLANDKIREVNGEMLELLVREEVEHDVDIADVAEGVEIAGDVVLGVGSGGDEADAVAEVGGSEIGLENLGQHGGGGSVGVASNGDDSGWAVLKKEFTVHEVPPAWRRGLG